MQIRLMEDRDIDAARNLLAILNGSLMTPEEMKNRLEMTRRSISDELFVYEDDLGVIRGVMGFRLRERIEHVSRYGEISALVTDSERRRSGIGRALVAFAEKRAAEKGCEGTWLASGFQRKDDAHLFYESLGYEKTGYRFVKSLKYVNFNQN